MFMYLRILMAIISLYSLAGCGSMQVTGAQLLGAPGTGILPQSSNGYYKDSSLSYADLVQKVNLAPSQRLSFRTTAAKEAWAGVPCRDALVLYMPEGETVDSYIEIKAIEALTAAGMYSPNSDNVVKVEINSFDLDSFKGTWVTKGRVTLPNGKTYNAVGEHAFETSFLAVQGCMASEMNIGPAVKQFLKVVLNHPEFQQYVQSARESGEQNPVMVENNNSYQSLPALSAIDTYSLPQGMPRDRLNYYALVIGNNHYKEFSQLHTAVNDASSVANILKNKYGFSTKLLLNASRDEILTALYNYRSKLSQNDGLLIYYAGHGWLDVDADEGYWLPVDANKESIINWLPNAAITSSIRAIQARHILVVADSCYSGTLSRGVNVDIHSPNYFDKMMKKKARSVLASGGLEPVTDSGGKENHSAFATAFLKALNENTGALDATGLFSLIRRPVMLSTEQTPIYSDIRKAGHEGGDFLFIRTDK